MASRLWRFLTTDVSELFSTDTVNATADKAGAVFGLAEVLQKEGPNVEELAPLVNQLDSLLDVLNSPLAEIVEKSLPFVSIATGLLKFYLEQSKKKLTLANCVALVSQAAYLESFKTFLQDETLLQQIGKVPTSKTITQQIQQLAELELSDEEARKAVTSFPKSTSAKTFGSVLSARLVQAGLSEEIARTLTERVAWATPRHMNIAWAASAEAVKHLGQPTFEDWRQEQAKYQDIDDYLEEVIQPEPIEKVFNEESLTFRDIYVPMEIQRLDQKGKPIKNEPPNDLETWVNDHLLEVDAKPSILFIQGEAGRGKSVFCRMFANRVRESLYPAYIPVLIRLRRIKTLETSLTQTLANYLETRDFVRSDPGWLTDDNTRFLFLLDGFDELLLEGRESGGLKEFLQQVEQFQKDSHHRFLITGRPLSLQGIERLISQAKGLERVELQPMDDELRERWYRQWAAKFGQTETDNFKHFLSISPKDVNDSLAREPLLLYLLGRMHREQQLRADMFAEAEGIDAKIVIYDEAVRWVIEEQRQAENLRLAGLENEDLRRVLMEAAVCVVQSGNEVAKVSFLEARLAQDGNNRVYELLQEARKNIIVSEKKLLNNLLTTFYIKPASGDREGSVEFAHKSFGEFLFAERLKDALGDWSQKGRRRGERYLVPNGEMWKEIYDLLGYGGLTHEIVDYLGGLLTRHSNFDPIQLFERLQDVYLRWWSGEFIDALSNNLPQDKMRRLREQIPEREVSLGLKQVDAYTGFNVMILLFELHRYGQLKDELKGELTFYLCGKPGTDEFDKDRLFRAIGYGECLGILGFNRFVASYLSSTNLSSANLSKAVLSKAVLSKAVLSKADLSSADLSSADLSSADLSSADLSSADLSSAYLNEANLSSANLSSAYLSKADLSKAVLHEADLSSADLSKAVLHEADLSSADLSSANLSSAYLDEANLSNANLRSAKLNGANLKEAYLSNAKLSGAKLSGAKLSGAKLSGANFSSADLSTADLSSADLSSAYLSSADLHKAYLSSADLSYANLHKAYLSSADLSYADFRSAYLNESDLSESDLSYANLSKANLSYANLSETDFRSADLSYADLSSADLSYADLSSADLSEANLSAADLNEANLNGTNLSGADLSGADLSGADLNEADLSETNLSAIKWNQETWWANARRLHKTRDVPDQLAHESRFAAAVLLSKGISYAEEAEIRHAIDAYNEAQATDPAIKISASSWNSLCWFGILHNDAEHVLFAAEKAVSLEPEDKSYRNNRGLAKALTGDLDGALIDFQFVLDSNVLLGSKRARQEGWVKALQIGENPFTREELESLRKAEGNH